MNPSSDPEHFAFRTLPGETFRPPDDASGERGKRPANGALSTWVMTGQALEWRSRICPLPIAGEAAEIFQLYDFWKAKVLPLAGGLYDQPAVYLKTMALLEQRLAITQKEAKR